jgi:hypothetical protein
LPSPIANRRREFESYREHYSRSKGRGCEIESGAPVVGGYTYNRQKISTKEHATTDTQNISGRQEKNRSGTAGTLGKNQGSKEGVVRCLEISGATALRIAAWNLIRAAKRLGYEVSPSPKPLGSAQGDYSYLDTLCSRSPEIPVLSSLRMFSAGGRGFSIVVVTASVFWSGIYPQGAYDTTSCPIHLPPKSGGARRCSRSHKGKKGQLRFR